MTEQMTRPAGASGGPGAGSGGGTATASQPYSTTDRPPGQGPRPLLLPPVDTSDVILAVRDAFARKGLIGDPYGYEAMSALALAWQLLSEDHRSILPHVLEPLEPQEVPPDLPLTDLGNAERLAARHGRDLRYCYPWRTWLIWDGRRWVRDTSGQIERYAIETVRHIYEEAAAEQDRRAALAAHATRSESGHRRREMIASAQALLPVRPDELDADPWLLNCLNGTVNLRTGDLHPHRREDMLTRLAPVHYDPDARLDLWERFLADATGGNADLAAFLQRAAGYTLTGNTGEEVLLFVHGPTNTGKSTFLEALKATLGDYATTADFETFLRRRDVGGPRPDIARLAGARLVASLEVNRGQRLAEGLLKMLTGGDTVTARELYSRAFEFRPAFKLWLAANHAPHIDPDDDAMWRRILKVPFEHVIPKGQRDPQVKATLCQPDVAGPAILAWAVRGCLAWRRDGLGVCPEVEAATAALRDEMDPVKDFLAECCILSPTAWTPSDKLREEYEKWTKERGEELVSGKDWPARLRAHGCRPHSDRVGGKKRRGWSGVGLLADEGKPSVSEDCDPGMPGTPGTPGNTIFDKPLSIPCIKERLTENSVPNRSTVPDQPAESERPSPTPLCRYWLRPHRHYWLRDSDGAPVCADCHPPEDDGAPVWEVE